MTHRLTPAILASLKELAFVAETVAHLRGMEADILPKTDRARALIAELEAFEPITGGDVTALNLYQRTHSGLVRITALFTDSDAANAHMAAHDGQSLLALAHGVALLADKADTGVTEAKVPAPEGQPAATVTVSLPVPPALVDSVLCTVIESGYDWFQWSDFVTTPDPQLPNIPTYVSAVCREWDGDEGEAIGEPVRVDAARIAIGVQKALEMGLVPSLVRGLANPDDLDIDLNEADVIAQLAVFGEVRYG